MLSSDTSRAAPRCPPSPKKPKPAVWSFWLLRRWLLIVPEASTDSGLSTFVQNCFRHAADIFCFSYKRDTEDMINDLRRDRFTSVHVILLGTTLELVDMEAAGLSVTVARRTRAPSPQGRVHGVSQKGRLLSCQALNPQSTCLALNNPLFYAQQHDFSTVSHNKSHPG